MIRPHLVAPLIVCGFACGGRAALSDDELRHGNVTGSSTTERGGEVHSGGSDNQQRVSLQGGSTQRNSTIVSGGIGGSNVIGMGGIQQSSFGGTIVLPSVLGLGGVAGTAPMCEKRNFFGDALVPFTAANDGAAIAILSTNDLDRDNWPDLIVLRNGMVNVCLGAGEGRFGPWKDYSDWTPMSSGVVTDLDGDGDLDIVVALPAWNSVKVFERGLTRGIYDSKHDLALPNLTNPQMLVASDMNSDGRIDLIVSDAKSYIRVFLGNESSSAFSEGAMIALSTPINSMRSSDIDSNGVVDLITLDFDGGINVYSGAKDREVGASVYTPTSVQRSLSLGDLNGDAYTDLVTTDGTSITKWIGLGDGTFASHSSIAAAGTIAEVMDVSADGSPEIVGSAADTGRLCVWQGAAARTASSSPSCSTISIAPSSLGVADFDRDGTQDIAIASVDFPAIAISYGDQVRRQNANTQRFSTQAVAGFPSAVKVADINADGILDVVTALIDKSYVLFHHGDGSGKFGRASRIGIGAPALALAIADYNDDGKLDVAALTDSSTLAISNQDQALLATLSLTQSYDLIANVDLNNDYAMDLVLAQSGTTSGITLLGQGDGKFRQADGFSTYYPIAGIAAADLDLDGIADLAVATASPLVEVARGVGNGSFGIYTRFSAGALGRSIMVADLNEDGVPDLVVGDDRNGAALLLGKGKGKVSFDYTKLSLSAFATRDLVVADFNGDGHLDVLGADTTSRALILTPGQGDGTFLEPYAFSVGVVPAQIAVGDVNRDARLDIVMGDLESATLAKWLNLCE